MQEKKRELGISVIKNNSDVHTRPTGELVRGEHLRVYLTVGITPEYDVSSKKMENVLKKIKNKKSWVNLGEASLGIEVGEYKASISDKDKVALQHAKNKMDAEGVTDPVIGHWRRFFPTMNKPNDLEDHQLTLNESENSGDNELRLKSLAKSGVAEHLLLQVLNCAKGVDVLWGGSAKKGFNDFMDRYGIKPVHEDGYWKSYAINKNEMSELKQKLVAALKEKGVSAE